VNNEDMSSLRAPCENARYKEMLSYRLGTVNDFHWGFKPVLIYSKPNTFSTLFGKLKAKMCIFSLRIRTDRYESKTKWVKKKEY